MAAPVGSVPIESLDTLWTAFLTEARAGLQAPPPAPTAAILRDDTFGEASLVRAFDDDDGIRLPPSADDGFFDDGHDLPPAILDAERGEVESQAAYIDELERLLVGSKLTAPARGLAASANDSSS